MRNFLRTCCWVLLASLFFSCKETTTVTYTLDAVFSGPETVACEGGQYFLYIYANGSWSASLAEDGTASARSTLSLNKGRGDAVSVVTVAANRTESGRSFKLSVVSEGLQLTIDFKQLGFVEHQTEPDIVPGRMEIPRLKTGEGNLFIRHCVDYNGTEDFPNYSLEYSCPDYHARWVAFSFDDRTVGNVSGRTNAWGPDPQVPAAYRTVKGDYNPAYARGHIVASNDRRYSIEANVQTFYYSNMSPMLYNFNGGVWLELENRVKAWGGLSVLRDTLYVVKGGTIDKDSQIIERYKNKVTVPKYYFMALLALKSGVYEGIAFYLEHREEYARPYHIEKYAVSISRLQELTGIDFFPNLPDDVEKIVESRYDTDKWPGL